MVHIKPDHFTLQTASAVSMMKGSSSFVSEWPAYVEEEVGSCIDHQNMTKLFTLLICTPQTVSDISLKSALENLMKEPSSSVSEEMVGSYILYVSRRRTKCIHFCLICTPQTASDISLKSALENLMKQPSSSVSEEIFSTSLTKCIHFSLICTPQTVSDISLKSALVNLMQKSSSFVSEVSSAGSVERKVDSAI